METEFLEIATSALCSKCKERKSRDCFGANKNKKNGLDSWCKDCRNQTRREKKQDPEYFSRFSQKNHEYYEIHKQRISEYHANRYIQLKPEISARNTAYRNLPESKEKSRKRYTSEEHKANKREKSKSPEYRRHRNEFEKQKKEEDLNYKLACDLRTRLNQAIKSNTKTGSAVRDLGCSIEELKAHLESKFQTGMTWENWGIGEDRWNIDHIIPLSAYDLGERQHVVLACYYLNLQPLWSGDNLAKGDKYPDFNAEQIFKPLLISGSHAQTIT